VTSKSPELPLSAVDLARLLALSDRQVRRLYAAGVLPKVGRRFDAFVCVPKFVAYLRTGTGDSADLSEARLKLTEAQRRDLELRTRQRSRKVVDLDEVATVFDAAMVIVASSLDGLAGRLSNELATVSEPALIRARLFDECRRIRNAAADQLEALAGTPPGRESSTSASSPDA
jgi:hypothetical protein